MGLAVGGTVTMHQGGARTILARDVTISQGGAMSVVAANVTFKEQAGALIVVARKVDGNLRVALDWRGALAIGASLVVVAALVRGRKHS